MAAGIYEVTTLLQDRNMHIIINIIITIIIINYKYYISLLKCQK